MEENVCNTCGGNCKFCKVTQIGGPIIIIALTWTLGMFFDMLYSKIAITVVAVLIAGTIFCPCRKVGAVGMASGSNSAAIKPAAVKAAPAKVGATKPIASAKSAA